jgi:hypothetical protein
MRNVCQAAILGVALLLFLPLGGCNQARMAVPVTGLELSRDYGPIVDVTNFRGSVTLEANPAKAPLVQARVRPMSRSAPRKGKELAAAVHVTAINGVEGGRRVLRVVSTPAGDPPAEVAVDLYIRVPRTEGARVHNAGGDVDLIRVEGPVLVDNGAGGAAGGDVYVRTGAAMTEPVSLRTTSGDVTYQVGPGSTGRFEITSDRGPAEFFSRLGEVKQVQPEFGRYRGVLNDGANDVKIHTGSGVARAMVLPNSGTYGPDLWNGWPRWPREPRPVGRLGGYYNEEPLFKKRPAAAEPQ